MTRPSEQRFAQIAIGVLLLAIVRSLGEVFRLRYLHGDALVVGQVTPIAVTAATLVLLFVYKVAVVV